MAGAPDIVCIGSVLWDIIGRAPAPMQAGADVPGRIIRQPGGVAMNVAMALRRFGLRPALLSAIGRDAEGEALIAECRRLGLIADHIHRSDDLPTDRYMAIEDGNGLIAAVADARSLEAAGARVLAALENGALGSAAAPWKGAIAIDGNLTGALMAEIAGSPLFALADLRVASASSGKAERLLPFLGHGRATLYVNLEEAGLMMNRRFAAAPEAAEALRARGLARALVTDGGRAAAMAAPEGVFQALPPAVAVTRVTGAGDTFMAAHIAAERQGARGAAALDAALRAAAEHISGVAG